GGLSQHIWPVFLIPRRLGRLALDCREAGTSALIAEERVPLQLLTPQPRQPEVVVELRGLAIAAAREIGRVCPGRRGRGVVIASRAATERLRRAPGPVRRVVPDLVFLEGAAEAEPGIVDVLRWRFRQQATRNELRCEVRALQARIGVVAEAG